MGWYFSRRQDFCTFNGQPVSLTPHFGLSTCKTPFRLGNYNFPTFSPEGKLYKLWSFPPQGQIGKIEISQVRKKCQNLYLPVFYIFVPIHI